MSVIASTDIYNQSDEVLFDKRTLDKLQNVDIEELDYEESSEEVDEDGNIIEDVHQIGRSDIVVPRKKSSKYESKNED